MALDPRDDGGQLRRADELAAQDWIHPGDLLDQPDSDHQGDEGFALFARFLSDLVPADMHCGGAQRKSRAAYNLFCAVLFRTSPAFVNGRTGRQMAKDLGIQYSTWKKHLERADRHLDQLGVRKWRPGKSRRS